LALVAGPAATRAATLRLVSLLMLAAGLVGLAAAGCGPRHTCVLLVTDLGEITVEVYPDEAPLTAANFLRYVREHRFEGATFYRTVTPVNQPDKAVKIEVIQGGLNDDPDSLALPPIPHETTAQTGLRHQDGTVSMARNEPGTASSEIFICIGDQPELDFGGKRNPDGQGFAAFGRVVAGMDVVRAIQERPAEGQWLKPAVRITGASLVTCGK
jgi:peptidyl-prolyl cis-trans isomerase A (cyclophilin A)